MVMSSSQLFMYQKMWCRQKYPCLAQVNILSALLCHGVHSFKIDSIMDWIYIGIYIWTILLSWYKQCQQLHWTNGRILGYRYSSEIDIYNCIRLGYRQVDELQHMSDTSNGKYPGYKQVGKTNKHMQLSWIYQDRYIRRYELWLHQDH